MPIALVGLVVLAPLLGVLALLIGATSRGPALFTQLRVGRNGRPFTLLKFRSMSVDRPGSLVTAAGDSRVTPVGRFLRRAKLDELPELWNVLRGEMSLVGPRPEVPGLVDVSDPAWCEVLSVRPGLTDPVTLVLRNEEILLAEARERSGDVETFYRDSLQRWKLERYAAYLRVRTPWSDLKTLMRTAKVVMGEGSAKVPTYDEIVRQKE